MGRERYLVRLSSYLPNLLEADMNLAPIRILVEDDEDQASSAWEVVSTTTGIRRSTMLPWAT